MDMTEVARLGIMSNLLNFPLIKSRIVISIYPTIFIYLLLNHYILKSISGLLINLK